MPAYHLQYDLKVVPESIITGATTRQKLLSLLDVAIVPQLARAILDSATMTNGKPQQEAYLETITSRIVEIVIFAVAAKKSGSIADDSNENRGLDKHIDNYLSLENADTGLDKAFLLKFLTELCEKDNINQNALKKTWWIKNLARKYLSEQKELLSTIDTGGKEVFINKKGCETVLGYLIDRFITTLPEALTGIDLEGEVSRIKAFISRYCGYFKTKFNINIEFNINVELSCLVKLLLLAIEQFKLETDFNAAKTHAEVLSPKSSSPIIQGFFAAIQPVSGDVKKFVRMLDEGLSRTNSEDSTKRFLRALLHDRTISDERLRRIFMTYKIVNSDGKLSPVFATLIQSVSPESIASPLTSVSIYSPRYNSFTSSLAQSPRASGDHSESLVGTPLLGPTERCASPRHR